MERQLTKNYNVYRKEKTTRSYELAGFEGVFGLFSSFLFSPFFCLQYDHNAEKEKILAKYE